MHHCTLDKAAGCLLGGAVGDALGAPVEFMRLDEILRAFGPAGITDFATAYGRIGAITDDTQMTMWTAEGLLRGWTRGSLRGIVSMPHQVYLAYLRWLHTQGYRSTDPDFARVTRHQGNGWLIGVPALFANRGPGNTCVSALKSGKMGTVEQPLNNRKGCGGVMRVAPVGMLYADPHQAFDLGRQTAAITHGHPCGYLSAGTMAAMVSLLAVGASLPEAARQAADLLAAAPASDECLSRVRRAIDLAGTGSPSAAKVESLGQGWVGEEALAIALYCALVHPDDLERALILAVNHGGDSDSTGAICGNLLGASLGVEAIPTRWLERVELRSELEILAADLVDPRPEDEAWVRRYEA